MKPTDKLIIAGVLAVGGYFLLTKGKESIDNWLKNINPFENFKMPDFTSGLGSWVNSYQETPAQTAAREATSPSQIVLNITSGQNGGNGGYTPNTADTPLSDNPKVYITGTPNTPYANPITNNQIKEAINNIQSGRDKLVIATASNTANYPSIARAIINTTPKPVFTNFDQKVSLGSNATYSFNTSVSSGAPRVTGSVAGVPYAAPKFNSSLITAGSLTVVSGGK